MKLIRQLFLHSGYFAQNPDDIWVKGATKLGRVFAILIVELVNLMPLVHLIGLSYTISNLTNQNNQNELTSYLMLLGFIICTLELAFFFYLTFKQIRLNQVPPNSETALDKIEREKILNLALDIAIDLKDTILGYIRMVNFVHSDKLSRAQVIHWLGWGLFRKRVDQLDEKEITELYDYADTKLDSKLFTRADAPEDRELQFFNQTPVKFQKLPLMVYTTVWGIQCIGNLWFSWLDFQYQRFNEGLAYWIRSCEDSNEPPIILIHGLGFGPAMYATLIYQLVQKHPKRTIILIQLDYVSMKLSTDFPTIQEHVAMIDHIFSAHNLARSTLVCHSYGSVPVTFFMKYRPHYFEHLHFLEPISFNLLNPKTIENFYYDFPKSFFQTIVRHFVANELSVKYCFYRYIWWDDIEFFSTYTSKFKGNVKVYYSEHDAIIHYPNIRDYFNIKLTNTKINVFKGLNHGEFLLSKDDLNRVIEQLD